MSELKGILPLLKPAGFTSHDCVNKLRKILKTKRIGHTGTLDPAVTGVLPICIGQATRVVEYIQDLPKEYLATVLIGKSTETEDAEGAVTEEREVTTPLLEEQVRDAFMSFVGDIEQVPPMYSAVKVNGVRLHQLAREGKEIERNARTVTIYRIDIESTSLNQPFPEVTFRVNCSKGTYVRTLCVDIGRKLGYPAHMSFLKRISSGPFQLEDCVTFEQTQQAVEEGRIEELLRPIDIGLLQYPEYQVNTEEAMNVFNGKRLKIEKPIDEGVLCRIYGPDQSFIALYQTYLYNGIVWGKPEKVFH